MRGYRACGIRILNIDNKIFAEFDSLLALDIDKACKTLDLFSK